MAARNRYARFLGKQRLNSKAPQHPTPVAGISRMDKALSYTAVTANLSQVLMLIVVVFGYIFTVRPVFQKEVVSEDLARLQIEQRKLQQQMDKQSESLAAGEARNKELADHRSAIEGQIATLNQKLVDAEKSARDAKLRAGKAVAEAKTAESSLSMLQNQHYSLKLQSLLGDLKLPGSIVQILTRTESTYSLNVFKEEQASAVAQKLKSLDLQPVDLAKTTLSQLQTEATKQARAPGGALDALLARNYQDGLTKHEQDLVCPEPVYADWQSAFEAAIKAGEDNIRSCINDYWTERTTKEGWTPSDVASLQKKDFWKEQERSYRASCKVVYGYIMQTAFQKAWAKGDKPCDERRMYVNHIVMGAPIETKLKPLTVANPPSPQEIAQLFHDRDVKAAEAGL